MPDKHDAEWLCLDCPGPVAGATKRTVHIRASDVAKIITDTKAGDKPNDPPVICYVQLVSAHNVVLFTSHETMDPKCGKMAKIVKELTESELLEGGAKTESAKK